MTALPISAFENYPDVRLRVWFNGGAGFQQLTPDQRIVSVGYALMAGTVQDGSITTAKLAPGVLTPGNFPANSVSSTQLDPARRQHRPWRQRRKRPSRYFQHTAGWPRLVH